jgi:hypothetical protein
MRLFLEITAGVIAGETVMSLIVAPAIAVVLNAIIVRRHAKALDAATIKLQEMAQDAFASALDDPPPSSFEDDEPYDGEGDL